MEADSSYCKVHLTNGAMMHVSIPLLEVLKHLCTKSFLRIHRSFGIHLLHVDSFYGNIIVMEGGTELPIGREYRKDVLENFRIIGSKSKKYRP